MEAKKDLVAATEKKDEVTSIQIALMKIVENPNIDPERLEKFLDLQVKMEDRQAQAAFNEALKGFQKDCPIIRHTKELKHGEKKISTYAPFDEIKHIIQPHLDVWGLAYSFSISPFKDNLFELITTIRHIKGHSEPSSFYFNPLIDIKGMNEAQQRKSALSYAKRAGIEDALGVVTANEDDDAKRTSMVPINESQIKEIKSLIDSTGADHERFFLYLGVATKKIEELSGADARKAIHALKQKKQQMEAQ